MTPHEVELPFDVDSPARARHFLGQLGDAVPAPVLGDLRLLVSELVTNALRHSGLQPSETIGLRVEVRPDDRVRVEVRDPGRNDRPILSSSDPELAGGWGLYLVETIADRWGVERDDATRVWFELTAASNGSL